ncbi:MAG: flavodoxin [Hespellia sp.]|nr:flavodoxin [Hespellia sp.]
MQIYYFSRTGRSKKIAEQLAERYETTARMIDDHRDWSGKVNYVKAGAMAMSGKTIPVDYEKPDPDQKIVVVFPLWASAMPPAVKTFVTEVGGEKITAVVTSLGSTLRKRDDFAKVIDLVGDQLEAPEI